MNHRIVLPFVCGLALLAAACDRPAPNNSSDAAQPSTLPAPSPSPDPAVDPATPQAIPVPEGTPGSTTDGTTPVTLIAATLSLLPSVRQAVASASAVTTRARCSPVISGNIGSERIRSARRSAAGKSPRP